MTSRPLAAYSADDYENAIAAALADENVSAAVSLLRRMAVYHPYRAERLLVQVEPLLGELVRRV